MGIKPTQPRTLVADDSDSMRQMLTMMLKKFGITEIIQASDGDQAIEILKGGEIGLLLLDWVMPRMDGAAVLRAIRTDAVLCSLPVVLITGNADCEVAKAVTSPELRADAILIKPLTYATFQEKLASVIARPALATA